MITYFPPRQLTRTYKFTECPKVIFSYTFAKRQTSEIFSKILGRKIMLYVLNVYLRMSEIFFHIYWAFIIIFLLVTNFSVTAKKLEPAQPTFSIWVLSADKTKNKIINKNTHTYTHTDNSTNFLWGRN